MDIASIFTAPFTIFLLTGDIVNTKPHNVVGCSENLFSETIQMNYVWEALVTMHMQIRHS